ncbi:hypothetical protein BJF78_12755 [Pseudonocardia sp. CNS-139]|nr:hypothetical protein BJF78_12755 [Pseudonocardia sp. CNS-139]
MLVLLSVRLMTEERPRLRTAVLLGVTAGLQVLVGEEILFDTGVVVALLLLVLVVSHPRTALRRAGVFTGRALVALAAFVLVAAVPMGFQLFGPLQQEGSPFNTAYYSVDLAGYVFPTRLQVIAPESAATTTETFHGGLEEHTGYLGWPLVVLAALAWWASGATAACASPCSSRSGWPCSRSAPNSRSPARSRTFRCRGGSSPGCPASST